jgi:hypothetical protein
MQQPMQHRSTLDDERDERASPVRADAQRSEPSRGSSGERRCPSRALRFLLAARVTRNDEPARCKRAQDAGRGRRRGGGALRAARLDLARSVSGRPSWIVTLKIARSVLLANKNDMRLTANFPTMAADHTARCCDNCALRFLGSRDFINITDGGGVGPRRAQSLLATSKHQHFRQLRASLRGRGATAATSWREHVAARTSSRLGCAMTLSACPRECSRSRSRSKHRGKSREIRLSSPQHRRVRGAALSLPGGRFEVTQ